jgi:hypothetical protein
MRRMPRRGSTRKNASPTNEPVFDASVTGSASVPVTASHVNACGS